MKQKPKVVLVIPSYNEALHIASLLKKISLFTKNNLSIIVVDDGSKDQTAELAESYAHFVLKHQINLGKGAALKTGCEFAFNFLKADFVIMMDADEQHAPNDLHKFIRRIEQGQQLILGVRSFDGMPKGPMLANKLTSLVLQFFYQRFIPDVPSGYKALSRRVYEQLEWSGSGYEVELEIAVQIATKGIAFSTVQIKTIYPNYIRGMTFLDGIKVFFKMFGVK